MNAVLKLYVRGPIGRTTDFAERFERGCREVMLRGYEPVSLVDGPDSPNAGVVLGELSEEEYRAHWLMCMRRDIVMLIYCDGIYLLRGWETSPGARLEKLIADGLGLLVFYQPPKE